MADPDAFAEPPSAPRAALALAVADDAADDANAEGAADDATAEGAADDATAEGAAADPVLPRPSRGGAAL